jgi:hypothetical protein
VSRRRHKNSTPPAPETPPPIVNLADLKDADGRLRDWDLPVEEKKKSHVGLYASLGFVAVLCAAAYFGFRLGDVKPEFPPNLTPDSSIVSPIVPKEVTQLPNAAAPTSNTQQQFTPRRVAGQTVLGKIIAPLDDSKWALAELPATGERIEVDRAGVYGRAKNFTEACIGAPDGTLSLRAAVRGRDQSTAPIRSYVTNGEICANVFDEPYMELDVSGELLGAQFGLQQGVPYIALKRIKQVTMPLLEVAKRPK